MASAANTCPFSGRHPVHKAWLFFQKHYISFLYCATMQNKLVQNECSVKVILLEQSNNVIKIKEKIKSTSDSRKKVGMRKSG